MKNVKASKIMLILSIVFLVVLLTAAVVIVQTNTHLQQTSIMRTDGKQIGLLLERASRDLTSQAESYILSGNQMFYDNYYAKLNAPENLEALLAQYKTLKPSEDEQLLIRKTEQLAEAFSILHQNMMVSAQTSTTQASRAALLNEKYQEQKSALELSIAELQRATTVRWDREVHEAWKQMNLALLLLLFAMLIIIAGLWIVARILRKRMRLMSESSALHSLFTSGKATANTQPAAPPANIIPTDVEALVEQRTRDLVDARDAIILGMSMLAEKSDKEVARHNKRMQKCTELITKEVLRQHPELLSPEQAERIIALSPLHDVGKAFVSDSILQKPAHLTSEEFEMLKSHTYLGADALKEAGKWLKTDDDFFRCAIEMAIAHHEKYDGSGYPYNLAGGEIPISACICAMAEIYEALTSDRPFKKALSHEKACEIIINGDGRVSPSHFHPFVLDAFMSVRDELKACQALEN